MAFGSKRSSKSKHASESKPDAFTNFTVKVDVNSSWAKTVKKVMKGVKGVTNFRMKDNGMINVAGYIDPDKHLSSLSKAGKEAKIVHWQYGECSSNLYDFSNLTPFGNDRSSGYYSYPNFQSNNDYYHGGYYSYPNYQISNGNNYGYNHSSDYGYSNYGDNNRPFW